MQNQCAQNYKSQQRHCFTNHQISKPIQIICCNEKCQGNRLVCAMCFITKHANHKQLIIQNDQENNIFVELISKYDSHLISDHKIASFQKITEIQKQWDFTKEKIIKKFQIIDQNIKEKKERIYLIFNGKQELQNIRINFLNKNYPLQSIQPSLQKLTSLEKQYYNFNLSIQLQKLQQMLAFFKDSKPKEHIIKNLEQIVCALQNDNYENAKGKKKDKKIKKSEEKAKQGHLNTLSQENINKLNKYFPIKKQQQVLAKKQYLYQQKIQNTQLSNSRNFNQKYQSQSQECSGN